MRTTRRSLLQVAAAAAITRAVEIRPRRWDAHGSPKKIAAVVSVYTHNSHADLIVGRLLEGYNLDGKSAGPNLKLSSRSAPA